MPGSPMQTEFEFTLPKGYVDADGNLHREGRMRLATAADEIEPLQDPRVQANQSYLTIILLARVVTELGDLETVNNGVVENLFVNDLEYLQAMYERINNDGANAVDTGCPECGSRFQVEVETGMILDQSPSDAGSEPMGSADPDPMGGGADAEMESDTGMDAAGDTPDIDMGGPGLNTEEIGAPDAEDLEDLPADPPGDGSGNPTE